MLLGSLEYKAGLALHGFQSEFHLGAYVAGTTHYSNVASDDSTGDESVLRSLGQLQMRHDADTDKCPLASAPEQFGGSGDTESLGQKLGNVSLDSSLSADQHISVFTSASGLILTLLLQKAEDF